jgi:endoglucanase
VVRAEAPVGFSAAVAPYLNALGMKAQAKLQQDRLIAAQDPATGLYGHPGEYYDENLALFSTGFIEQRFRFERDGRLHLKWK